MFEKLLQFENHNGNAGVIWSMEGGLYLAFEMSPSGSIVRRAKPTFRSLELARDWLQNAGVKSISLRQSSAYFEMIGQESETQH